MSIQLYPLPGRVLVEVHEKYANVAVTEQKYDTKTFGTLLLANARDIKNEGNRYDSLNWAAMVNKTVFWEEYKDGQIIERDGKKYAFIKIEDLDGYEDEQSK